MVGLSSTLLRYPSDSARRVEKYRPNTLDDVVGNTETIERLKIIARDGNCPHIIISVSLLYLQWWIRVLNVGVRRVCRVSERPRVYIVWHIKCSETRIKRVYLS